ncbi:MAG: hypothetical protein DME97_18525 [Verrucomicrobia bacterium]|nr:MAG: hypothetical protein DME97_18525 [Verrucomicrobiota bacterium]
MRAVTGFTRRCRIICAGGFRPRARNYCGYPTSGGLQPPNICGDHRSTIIDPYGVIIAAASQDREELIQAEISEDAVKSLRSQMEVFAHRRPDVL